MSSTKKKQTQSETTPRGYDIRSFFAPRKRDDDNSNDSNTTSSSSNNTPIVTSTPPISIVSTPPSTTTTTINISMTTTPPLSPLIQSSSTNTNTSETSCETNTTEKMESKEPINNENDNTISNNHNNNNNNDNDHHHNVDNNQNNGLNISTNNNDNDNENDNNDNNNDNDNEHQINNSDDGIRTPLPTNKDEYQPPSSFLRRSARITHKKEEEKAKRPLPSDEDDDLLSSNPLSFSASVVQIKPKRLKYSLDKLLEEKVSGVYDEVEKWTSLLEEGAASTKIAESEESKKTMEKMNQLVSFRDELAESEEIETIFTQSPVNTPFSLTFPDPIPEKYQKVVSKILEMTKNVQNSRELITVFDIIGAFVKKDSSNAVVPILIQWVVDAMVSVRDLEGFRTNVAVIDRGVEIFGNYISQSGKKFAGLFHFPSQVLSLNNPSSSHNPPTPNWIPSFDFFVSLLTRFGVSIQVVERICNRTAFVESAMPVLISASTSSSQFPSYNFQGILHILHQSVTAFPTSFSPQQYTSFIALVSKIMIDPVVRILSPHLSALLATLITNYHSISISSWQRDLYDLCEILYSSCSFNLSKLKFVKNIPIVNDICYSFKRKFAVYTAARLLEMEVSEDLIRENLSLPTITKLLKNFNNFGEYSGVVVACLIDIAFGSDKSMMKSRSQVKEMLSELRSVNNRIREVGGYDLIKTKLKDIVILLIGKASILESECNFSSQRTLFD